MTQTITPLSMPANLLPDQPQYTVSDSDRARQQAISSAWDAYFGNLDAPLTRLPGQPDDNVLSNRCQPIVDRGIDFLFGKEIEISVEEGSPAEAQTLLDSIWGRKETRIPMLQKLAMNGAIAGQAFLRIVPGNDGKTFRLVVLDPSTVFPQSVPGDCETIMLYCVEYSTTEKQNGKPVQVYYHEEISRIDPDGDASQGMIDTDDTWQVQHWSRIGDRGAWTPAGDTYIWPYFFPPIFGCQNLPKPNDVWGMPDLTTDLIGVNNSLNLVQSCVNRVLKLYGQPILYATGTGESVIDIRPGRIIGLPTTESKIVAVPIASDVVNALAFAGDLRSDIDEQSSVPGVATGRISAMPRGSLSGIAIELLFQPLILKTTKKQMLYGSLLIEVSKALLVLNHLSGDIDITLDWQNALPHEDLPAAQYAIALKELGVSSTSILRQLGFDPEEEMALSKTEAEQKLEMFLKNQETMGGGIPPALPGTPALPGQPAAPPQAQPAQPAQSPFIGRSSV